MEKVHVLENTEGDQEIIYGRSVREWREIIQNYISTGRLKTEFLGEYKLSQAQWSILSIKSEMKFPVGKYNREYMNANPKPVPLKGMLYGRSLEEWQTIVKNYIDEKLYKKDFLKDYSLSESKWEKISTHIAMKFPKRGGSGRYPILDQSSYIPVENEIEEVQEAAPKAQNKKIYLVCSEDADSIINVLKGVL